MYLLQFKKQLLLILHTPRLRINNIHDQTDKTISKLFANEAISFKLTNIIYSSACSVFAKVV